MEDEEDRLVILGLGLLLHELLVLLEKLRAELDVSWRVNSMNVSEACCDREILGDSREFAVDVVNILWPT
jgi:hypothetical protein